MTEVRNFIAHLIHSYIAVDTTRRKSDIRNRLDMSRQSFDQFLKPGSVVTPFNWPQFRKGLGMSREDFWSEAMDFHDPE